MLESVAAHAEKGAGTILDMAQILSYDHTPQHLDNYAMTELSRDN